MEATTFDVRVYKTDVYVSKRRGGRNTHWVRWKVGQRQFKRPYATAGLATSFRAELVGATSKGEAFRVADGLPVSMARTLNAIGWYEFACEYVDMKWPHVAATTRRTHAEALTPITIAMLTGGQRGQPDDALLRHALCRWGFNTVRRDLPDCPHEVVRALCWVRENTRPVTTLNDPDVVRTVLNSLAVKLDGTAAAATVTNRRRSVFSAALEYAVERKLLARNPIPALKWRPPKSSHAIDRRRVPNPMQVRSLLAAVREQRRSGPRLVAFFACLYFAALRPEEAAALSKRNLNLPTNGWSELLLDRAQPHAGRDWTDSGHTRDDRQLKHRARGATRTVPAPPELTAYLSEHLDRFGTASDGRLFTGERSHGELPKLTIARAWRQARAAVFTPEVAATALAATPYDLRHAGVSTWLTGGIPPTTVAEWAGHSVEVLLKIYATCLDGTDAANRLRVQTALGHRPE